VLHLSERGRGRGWVMMYGSKGTKIKVPKSSKSTQEQARPHRQAAQLDFIRPIDHLTSTTTRTQRYTRATVHPPAREYLLSLLQTGTEPRRVVMTCSILSLQEELATAAPALARGRQKLCRRNAAVLRSPERTLVLESCV